jgi:hypothetical protein
LAAYGLGGRTAVSPPLFLAIKGPLMATHICHGSTQPEDWVQHPTRANQIYVDVDTSACRFAETPVYVSSLVGESHHWSIAVAAEVEAQEDFGE